MQPLTEELEDLRHTHRVPVYIVHFTQAAALERAQALTSIALATREQRDEIAELIGDFQFSAGFGRTLSRLVRHGIGVHHAGMLPKYRRLVERLAQSGLLQVICGTDTLGVGINVPIRTVLLTALAKYDGTRTRQLTAREFHQIAGRAGRAGFDSAGDVVVMAPEHVIETEKALAKAGDDPAKRRKVVRRKAPDGFVSWGEPSFQRLVQAEPEPLTSHFVVTHAMLLGVLSRPEDAVAAMRRLIEESHEPRDRQLRHIRRAIAIARGLIAAGVVERLDELDEFGRRYRLTVDLPTDFALDQPLSPLALAALEILDREAPSYAVGRGVTGRGGVGRPGDRVGRAAVQGARRGGGGDEGRGHRVRGADGAARGGRPSEAAGRPRRGRLRVLPGRPSLGRRVLAANPSRWSGTCTNGP